MHLLKLRLGKWEFSPSLWPTLAAVFFFVLTLWLGNWQSERAESKRVLQSRYDAASEEAPVRAGATLLARDSVLYRRLEVHGAFDDAHTILLDNRVMAGVAGYHVLTPLRIDESGLAILVNRGWTAAGPSRAELPSVPPPSGRVKLEGVAVDPHTRYIELATTAPQGRVWQNLDFERYERVTGLTLQPVLLLQTSGPADGLQRAWDRPDTGVNTHVSYALQWYGLSVTLLALWLVTNVRRYHDSDASSKI